MENNAVKFRTKRLGVIGGLGAIAGADVFFKLIKLIAACGDNKKFEIVFEQHPFAEDQAAGSATAGQNARKLYVFDMIRQFERRKIDAVILPCFISHSFLDEIESEIKLPVVNIMKALRLHVERRYPEARRLGVLTSSYVRQRGLFDRFFPPPRYKLIYPASQAQEDWLMPAIYGPHGIKTGNLQGEPFELLYKAGRDLMEQGAEVILPGFAEVSMVVDALRESGLPIFDANQVYVQYAVMHAGDFPANIFKVGIIGGVGPMATVDFMNKIIRNTRAKKDQEHIKLVVEHNPQIPDRTESLTAGGPDPTVALYSACKRLEAADANMIAIPCNTAHAFVERIQPYLSIPIINMLSETMENIRNNYGRDHGVGLLATSGTLKSGVYRDFADKAGIRLIVPEDEYQRKVMDAIYGEKGVKAGYTEGQCRENLMQALEHLVRRGADVIILGCTELPLLLSQSDDFPVAGKKVVILDPTEILARKCVSLSREAETLPTSI